MAVSHGRGEGTPIPDRGRAQSIPGCHQIAPEGPSGCRTKECRATFLTMREKCFAVHVRTWGQAEGICFHRAFPFLIHGGHL